MNILRSYSYDLNTVSSTVQDHVTIDANGSFLRCVKSTADFEISIDGGARTPFGVARAFRAAKPFSKVEIFKTDALGSNPITVVIADGEYSDDRAVISTAQEIAATRATSLTAADIVFGAGVPVPATGGLVYQICLAAGTLLVNVRNLSAVNAVRIATDLATLAAGGGYYLGAGENADIPFGGSATAATATLYVKGTLTETVIATRFLL